MTTLADRLRAAIDAAKKDLNDRIDAELTRLAASGNWMTRNDLMRLDAERGDTYAREERRCAADRKILDLHDGTVTVRDIAWNKYRAGFTPTEAESRDASQAERELAALQVVVEALAEAYGVEADRD